MIVFANENNKNFPYLRWGDYNWESLLKTMKIHSVSGEVTILEKPQKHNDYWDLFCLSQAGWITLILLFIHFYVWKILTISMLAVIDYWNFTLLPLYAIIVCLYSSSCDNPFLLIYPITYYSTFTLFDLTTLLTNSFMFCVTWYQESNPLLLVYAITHYSTFALFDPTALFTNLFKFCITWYQESNSIY